MELRSTKWEQKMQALTHILTHQTTKPTLHSQVFISSQIPCYLNWDYPPILCPKPFSHFTWAFSLFFKRASRFGLPRSSWRAKCPYHQPPSLVFAKGIEEAKWGDEDKRIYVRNRLKRKRLGSDIHPLVPILLPNLFLFSLLLWDPFPLD